MKRIAVWSVALVALVHLLALAYGLHGYFSARADAPSLSAHAERLIEAHRGPADLGRGRIDQLLMVEDPGFWGHRGVDLTSPGAGYTSLTQSVGKRVGFRHFEPGVRKIRLMGYAMGLESRLSKEQILALFLDTAWMGRGPKGTMSGFFTASRAIYGAEPADLSDRDFHSLIAVLIAPDSLRLAAPDEALSERIARIDRLVRQDCRPLGARDVWLEGCA